MVHIVKYRANVASRFHRLKVGPESVAYCFSFFNMTVCCVFSLEPHHGGDSNEYTQYTIFNMNKKNNLNYPKSAAMGVFPRCSNSNFYVGYTFKKGKKIVETDCKTEEKH